VQRPRGPFENRARSFRPLLSALAGLALASCAATPSAAPARVADDLSEADVKRTIEANFPQIRRCIQEHRRRHPDWNGKMLVQFHILQSGETSEVSARGEPPDSLAACVTAVFSAMQFPQHQSDPEPVLWPMKY
jgi:hypothetical protein